MRFLQEASCIKDPVLSLKPEVTARLPIDLSAGPVTNESCATIICRPDQKSWYSIHAILKIFPPLKNPVHRPRHPMGKCSIDARMNVHEVDGTGTSCGQNPKVLAFRKQRIERSQRFRVRVISAADVSPCDEARFQLHGRKSVAGFGRDAPCQNVTRTEGAELPEGLVVEIPSRPIFGDRAGNSGSEGVAHFLRGTSLEGRLFSVQTQVIHVYRNLLECGAGCVDSPETNRVVGHIVEESEIVHVRTQGKSVDLPVIDLAFHH